MDENSTHEHGKCMCQLCAPDWVLRPDTRFAVRVDGPDSTEHSVVVREARQQARHVGQALLLRHRLHPTALAA